MTEQTALRELQIISWKTAFTVPISLISRLLRKTPVQQAPRSLTGWPVFRYGAVKQKLGTASPWQGEVAKSERF